MLSLITYTNNSPADAVPKNLTGENTISGVLREGCSIQNPAILVDQTAVPTFNYAYIPEFGRYYYVAGITNFSTNLWLVQFHCDVLQSFWTSIKACPCIIERNQYKRTADLQDNMLLATADSLYSVQKFPNTPFSSQVDRRFVLVLNGAGYGGS